MKLQLAIFVRVCVVVVFVVVGVSGEKKDGIVSLF